MAVDNSVWHKLGSPTNIMAPMVDHSDLPFRMLGRKHGVQLCFTPMLHAALFDLNEKYREEMFTTCDEDRPLVVQFCANDPEVLLRAARRVEHQCDAVDINFGCPQAIAKSGYYGAFLQDDWTLISRLVSTLHKNLSVPVTCKIRILDSVEKTVEYARMVEAAGCQLLTVHGRDRSQKGQSTGLANWDVIRAVKEALTIPVFANGNILYHGDVLRCIDSTGVNGVMSAEGLLYNPALFSGHLLPLWLLSEEYLELCAVHPIPVAWIKGHLHKLWHKALPHFTTLRERLNCAANLDDIHAVVVDLKAELQALEKSPSCNVVCPKTQLPIWLCQPFIRPLPPTLSSAEVLLAAQRAQNTATPIIGNAEDWITKGMNPTPIIGKKRRDDGEEGGGTNPKRQKTAAEKKAERVLKSARELCCNFVEGKRCTSFAKSRCIWRFCQQCCRQANQVCEPHRTVPRKQSTIAQPDTSCESSD
eukprot:GGOE01043099.1.p1 GENE.GGOE01043099.1~~GGOE01043099.1.p1  ORF type:complete len:474 (-),score=54.13 GGOE01043099.1:65-1486(-)